MRQCVAVEWLNGSGWDNNVRAVQLCESQACAWGTDVRVRLVRKGRLCESGLCVRDSCESQACA
jgi:hypothetical protein